MIERQSGEITDSRLWLKEQLEVRQKRVPSYSLRCFAQKIGLSPASVSQILSGKRPLSRKAALQISDKLGLSPDERLALVRTVVSEKVRGLSLEPEAIPEEENIQIELDTFRVISDWYHYAILNLLKIDTLTHTPRHLSRRLNISLWECEQALLRMRRLGLIEKTPDGYKRTCKTLHTPTDIPNTWLRKFHLQNLRKAEESLERDNVETRYFQTDIVAIDPANLQKAKALISKMGTEVSHTLEKGKQKRVYAFVTQLFPLDQVKESFKEGH